MRINKPCQQRAVAEFRLVEQVFNKGKVRVKAFDLKVSDRALRLGHRAGKNRAAAVGDHFREQRIIPGAGLIAFIGKAIDPNTDPSGRCILGYRAAGGFEKTFFR